MTVSASVVGTFYSAGSDTSIVVTATVGDGSYLHAAFTYEGGLADLAGVTSVPALTWTRVDNSRDAPSNQTADFWRSSATTAGSITVTASLGTNSDAFRGGAIKEITGSRGYDDVVSAAHAINQQTGPGGTTDAVTSTATSALSAQPALVSGFSVGTNATVGPNVGTGFASDGAMGWTNVPSTAESKRVTSTSAIAATFTATDTGGTYVSNVAVFLEGDTKVITENSTGGNFAGEVDARMDESTPTSSNNGAIETLSSGVSTRFRSLLKFTGLSNIPSNATITSVSLRLYVELVDGDCETRLLKVLRNWSSPTWNQYTSGSNWTTGGCDGIFTDHVSAVSAIKSIVAANAGSYQTWTDLQMRSDVQSWVDGSAVNNGWLLQNTNDTTAGGTGAVFGHALGTDGHRPILIVGFSAPNAGGVAGVDQQMTVDLYF